MGRQDMDQGQSRDRLLVILFIAFALLQAADIFTTNLGLGLGLPGVDESNPVVAHIMHHLGQAWWLPKFMLVALALMGTSHPRPSMVKPAYAIAVAVSLFTVANNILFFQLH